MSNLIEKILAVHLTEIAIDKLFREKKIGGSLHLSLGQEAIDVGVINSLNKPLVFGNHRSHGQYLAATNDLEGLFRQLKKGMSQHLYYSDMFMSNGIQGGLTATAVGAALAYKKQGVKRDVVCFIGDGTFGQGILYESLRLASLLNLNILFVVIRNKYAMSKTQEINEYEYYNIAEAFKFQVHEILEYESRDIEEVCNSLKYNLDGDGHKMLIANTVRLCGHSISDTQMYRPKEELSGHTKKLFCPIACLKESISDKEFNGLLNKINTKIEKTINNVF